MGWSRFNLCFTFAAEGEEGQGEEGSSGSCCGQEAGGQESGEPPVWEETQKLWHRWVGTLMGWELKCCEKGCEQMMERIFANWVAVLTSLFHQDLWCRCPFFVLEGSPPSLQNDSSFLELMLYLCRSGYPAQKRFDSLCEMASLHPAPAPTGNPLQKVEGAPSGQPVHPSPGPSDG